MVSSNGKLDLIKRNSRAQIIMGVLKYAPVSRVDLAKSTGLSLTCVSRTMDDLIDEGIIIETGFVSRPRGRPKVMLEINPNAAPAVGLRIGPESTEIAVANPRGEILSRHTIPYGNDDLHPDAAIDEIASGVRLCLKSVGKETDKLRGVGVTAAGLVDPLMGTVDGLTNRRGWENVHIVDMLSSRLGVPVFVDNDVRAAAIASQCFSSDSSEGGSLYVYVSEGIGAAYVQDNRELLRGVHDAAGLLGHIVIQPDGPLCGCGNRGCLETLASDIAFITRIWPELSGDAHQLTILERAEYVRKGIDLAKSGDSSAGNVLNSVAGYLGAGIASAIMMLDPGTVHVFGTMIDTEPDLVMQMVREEALKLVWQRSKSVDIRPLMNWQEFLLRGSIGLVLWQPFKQLQEDNMNSWMVV